MNRLIKFLRRMHCIEAHQTLVLEALERIQTPAGLRLRPWLLLYHRDLLRGVLDPDVRFRDFHNHVLHVAEGFWGGGPRVAHQWYDRLEKELGAEKFPEVAHAAGVLCHYIVDVINPLHTVNHFDEANVHFAFETSVQSNLPAIRKRATELGLHASIRLSSQPAWLGSLMMHAAKYAHRRSAKLIADFPLQTGLENPERALDSDSIERLAELYELAVSTVARVLERAAEQFESDSGFPIPHCHWRWAWLSAVWHVPGSAIRKYGFLRGVKRQLSQMSEEIESRGRLVESLPAEVDIKQRVHKVYHCERRRAYQARKTIRPRRRAA
ncbi:MAG: zinc dependent phospholipase C family protein [Planctomycetota bacterium]